MMHLRWDADGVRILLPPRMLAIIERTVERLRNKLEAGQRPTVRGEGPGTAFAQDPALQRELAGVLDGYVAAEKARQLTLLEQSLRDRRKHGGALLVARADLPQWLACVNDLRLVLAAELHLPEDWSSIPWHQHNEPHVENLRLFLDLSQLEERIVQGMR